MMMIFFPVFFFYSSISFNFSVHASVGVRHVHFPTKEEFVGLAMNHAKHVPELDKIHALHALQLICMLLIWPFVCKSVQMAIMKVSKSALYCYFKQLKPNPSTFSWLIRDFDEIKIHLPMQIKLKIHRMQSNK